MASKILSRDPTILTCQQTHQLVQNVKSTRKPLQNVVLGTESMWWVKMALFHVITTARPTCNPWFLGKENKNKERGMSVANRLNATRAKLITKNQYYLKTILEALLIYSQQNIATWGHHESMKSLNTGNFWEILELVTRHDGIVDIWS